MVSGLKVWVTRAQPGAGATAERLTAMGHSPVIAPLLEVREREFEPDLTGVAALAFTSSNAVRAFARQPVGRNLPVYAVGEATAQAARAAGFATIANAAGDAAALAAMIAANPPAGEILWPTAPEHASDIGANLATRGIKVRSLTVYETRFISPPDGFDPQEVDAVLVHSPKAGRGLAVFLSEFPAPDLEAYCISLSAAAPLAATPLDILEAAAEPTETALLALL